MRRPCHGAEGGVDRGRCSGDLACKENVARIECVRGDEAAQRRKVGGSELIMEGAITRS